MSVAPITLQHYSNKERVNPPALMKMTKEWLARIFGCWHLDLSRPYTREGQTCRVCLDCGARRQFNLERWEMQGPYYYEAPSSYQFGASKAAAQTQSRPAMLRIAA